MSVGDLPSLNAVLNSISSLLLFTGYWAIKNKKESLHKKLMCAAFVVSSLFLASYLYYHFHFPVKKFPDLGWIKIIYLSILFTHIILAVVMLPMIFVTFKRAFKGEREAHKKLARWTFPVWAYVSVTGVIIYFMLYHWFA